MQARNLSVTGLAAAGVAVVASLAFAQPALAIDRVSCSSPGVVSLSHNFEAAGEACFANRGTASGVKIYRITKVHAGSNDVTVWWNGGSKRVNRFQNGDVPNVTVTKVQIF